LTGNALIKAFHIAAAEQVFIRAFTPLLPPEFGDLFRRSVGVVENIGFKTGQGAIKVRLKHGIFTRMASPADFCSSADKREHAQHTFARTLFWH